MQPTIELIQQTADQIRSLGFSAVEAVHSHSVVNDAPGAKASVVGAVMRILNDPPLGGFVLLITTSAFLRLPFVPVRERWHLFMDEPPQVHGWFDGSLGNFPELFQSVKPGAPDDKGYAVLSVTARARLRKLGMTASREGDSCLADCCFRLGSKAYKSMVRIEAVPPGSAGSYGGILSLLQPSVAQGFKSVVLVGADLEDGLLFAYWQQCGVRFREHTRMSSLLRFRQHEGGHLLEIAFSPALASWSKFTRDKTGLSINQRFARGVLEKFGDNQFIFSANKDIEHKLFEGKAQAIMLPHNPHGLNSYSQIDRVFVYSSYNLSPMQNAYLADNVVCNKDEISRSIHLAHVYQAALRSSLRDPSSTTHKQVIVPDQQSAEFLSAKFPGSSLTHLDIGLNAEDVGSKLGRPAIHANATAKNIAWKQRKRAKLEAKVLEMMLNVGHIDQESVAYFGDENSFKEMDFVTQFYFCEFQSEYQTHADPRLYTDYKEFVSFMRQQAKKKYTSKECIPLMSLSFFVDTGDLKTKRGRENVVFANGILLDLENGDLDPCLFAEIFPFLKFLSFNTFSSTPSSPRFRIYIPTSTVMSAEQYGFIVRSLVQQVVGAGFPLSKRCSLSPLKAHGIDQSKLDAECLYRMPCQALYSQGSWFRSHQGAGRAPLNVGEWLARCAVVDGCAREADKGLNATLSSGVGLRDDSKAEAARCAYRVASQVKGEGNSALFKLGLGLATSGCSEGEVWSELEVAAHATNSADRMRGVPGILKSLRNYGHFVPNSR